MGIIPLLTFYSSHFLRVICLTFKNRKRISEFFKDYGYLIHCDNCGFRSSFRDNILEVPDRCPKCEESNKIKYAGPLWINNIHQLEFVSEMIALNNQSQYKNKNRISFLLNLIKEEIAMPISFYNTHILGKIFKISNIPKINTIIDSIREKGYQASRTHFDFLSIKTNMGIKAIKNILLELQH
jgi:tRNA (guanine26-N2/guanine27-N2)-dimethyltransferase